MTVRISGQLTQAELNAAQEQVARIHLGGRRCAGF